VGRSVKVGEQARAAVSSWDSSQLARRFLDG
jgi:hypothetical protein